MIDSSKTIRVRIPAVTDIGTAIRKYYEKTELANADIREIFGAHSSATISKLKGLARQRMVEQGTPSWNENCVNTRNAYESWGLNIEDLERRYKKLKEFSV